MIKKNDKINTQYGFNNKKKGERKNKRKRNMFVFLIEMSFASKPSGPLLLSLLFYYNCYMEYMAILAEPDPATSIIPNDGKS